MNRAFWIACLVSAASMAVSCGRKPDAPNREGPGEAAEAETEVGAGDVVDYAIGKKQLEAKKRIESQIDDIQRDRDRRIEEALGE